MTDYMQEILESTEDVLTPDQVAKVLKCNSQSIRDQAKSAPGMLGFPVTVIGTRVQIPRVGFCRWMGYDAKHINGLPA